MLSIQCKWPVRKALLYLGTYRLTFQQGHSNQSCYFNSLYTDSEKKVDNIYSVNIDLFITKIQLLKLSLLYCKLFKTNTKMKKAEWLISQIFLLWGGGRNTKQ